MIVKRIAVDAAVLHDVLDCDLVERTLVEQLQERSADRTLGQRCHGLHLPFLPIMPQTGNFCKEKTSKKTGPSGEAS